MPTPTEDNARKIVELNVRVGAAERTADKAQELATGHATEIAELKTEVKQLKADRDELRKQLEDLKGRMWAFAVGLLLVLVGALVAVFKK